jgi:hypothetical protein
MSLEYQVKSYPLIPSNSKSDVNYHNINGVRTIRDTNINSITYGIYRIDSTSNVDNLIKLFDNEKNTYWNTLSEYGQKSDDPLTSVTVTDSESEICGGDNYKKGSCIHNYSGERKTENVISYYSQEGTNILTSTYPGETIDVVFPRAYYIYESYLEFNQDTSKPKAYFILGYSDKDKVWRMIARNLNVDSNTNEDRLKINTIDKYKSIKLIITAGRETDNVSLNQFNLFGNTKLIGNPIRNYNGTKDYNKHDNFENINQKNVSFSDNIEVFYYNKNQYYEKIFTQYFPTFLILSILGLAIIKKK